MDSSVSQISNDFQSDPEFEMILPLKRATSTSSASTNDSGNTTRANKKLQAIYHNYHTFTADGVKPFDSQRYIIDHPTTSRLSMYSSIKSNLNDYYVWSYCGEWYRKFCFTSIGMKCLLSINVLLLFLNIFLIIYETVLLLQIGNYYWTHSLPLTFLICDVIITIILIIEVLLHWLIGYDCRCYQYLCNSTFDNKIDFIVMLLSLFCCFLYAINYTVQNWDNLLFLGIRFIRDALRIIRCYFFFKLLYGNLTFDFNDINTLQIKHENKSVTSQFQWDQYAKQKELHLISPSNV